MVIQDVDCYVVGSKLSKKAIMLIYDIFGFHPSTKLGADILADAGFLIIMPDFFRGKPLPQSLYPPTSAEAGKTLSEFFSTQAIPTPHANLLSSLQSEVSKLYSIETWGYLGLCWGFKVAILAASQNPCSALASAHPSMIDPTEVPGVTVPVLLIASKEEPVELLTQFEANLKPDVKKQSRFETYGSMHHGFAASRARFDDEDNREKFTLAYQEFAKFFNLHV